MDVVEDEVEEEDVAELDWEVAAVAVGEVDRGSEVDAECPDGGGSESSSSLRRRITGGLHDPVED